MENKKKRNFAKDIVITVILVISIYLFFSYGLQIVLGTSVPIAVVESNSMYPL